MQPANMDDISDAELNALIASMNPPETPGPNCQRSYSSGPGLGPSQMQETPSSSSSGSHLSDMSFFAPDLKTPSMLSASATFEHRVGMPSFNVEGHTFLGPSPNIGPTSVTVPRHIFTKTMQENEYLKARVQELELEKARIEGSEKSIQNAFKLLATAHPELLPNGMLVPQTLRAAKVAPVPYDQALHGKMKFYKYADYQPYGPRGVKNLGDSDEDDGDDEDEDDDNKSKKKKTPRYLETRDGTTLSYAAYCDLRAALKRAVLSCNEEGLAAPTWKALGSVAYDYIKTELCAHWPGFMDSENGWKFDEFGKRVYPDVLRDRSKEKTKTIKRAASQVDSPLARKHSLKRAKTTPASGTPAPQLPEGSKQSDSTSVTSGTASTASESAIPAQTPLDIASRSEPVLCSLPLGLSVASSVATHSQSLTRSPSVPGLSGSHLSGIVTDHGPADSTTSVWVPSPESSANSSRAPSPFQDAAPRANMAALPQPSLTGSHTDVVARPAAPKWPAHVNAPPVVTTTPAPTEESGSNQAYIVGNPLSRFRKEDAVPLPDLLAGIKMTAAPKTSSPSDSRQAADSNTSKKKPTKMRVSKNRTARNMYAYVYKKGHPNATTQEYDVVWKALEKLTPATVVMEYKGMELFAADRPGTETIPDVIEAWNALSDVEKKDRTTGSSGLCEGKISSDENRVQSGGELRAAYQGRQRGLRPFWQVSDSGGCALRAICHMLFFPVRLPSLNNDVLYAIMEAALTTFRPYTAGASSRSTVVTMMMLSRDLYREGGKLLASTEIKIETCAQLSSFVAFCTKEDNPRARYVTVKDLSIDIVPYVASLVDLMPKFINLSRLSIPHADDWLILSALRRDIAALPRLKDLTLGRAWPKLSSLAVEVDSERFSYWHFSNSTAHGDRQLDHKQRSIQRQSNKPADSSWDSLDEYFHDSEPTSMEMDPLADVLLDVCPTALEITLLSHRRGVDRLSASLYGVMHKTQCSVNSVKVTVVLSPLPRTSIVGDVAGILQRIMDNVIRAFTHSGAETFSLTLGVDEVGFPLASTKAPYLENLHVQWWTHRILETIPTVKRAEVSIRGRTAGPRTRSPGETRTSSA
ncbi:hypothetical protein C8T65DRAFT_727879 [Cerioporus squamosus]|nr:hypothetical protein C8T65DRAFT_727879 [Cerioporus squamosus]